MSKKVLGGPAPWIKEAYFNYYMYNLESKKDTFNFFPIQPILSKFRLENLKKKVLLQGKEDLKII